MSWFLGFCVGLMMGLLIRRRREVRVIRCEMQYDAFRDWRLTPDINTIDGEIDRSTPPRA
jgi:hypothetical protein